MKISFDFDNTLSKLKLQNICHRLINKNHDVWIVTSRCNEVYGIKYDNNDLFNIAYQLNIPNEKIHFTNACNKDLFLINNRFDIHLDDDRFEIDLLKNSDVIGINVTESFWIDKLREIVEI